MSRAAEGWERYRGTLAYRAWPVGELTAAEFAFAAGWCAAVADVVRELVDAGVGADPVAALVASRRDAGEHVAELVVQTLAEIKAASGPCEHDPFDDAAGD